MNRTYVHIVTNLWKRICNFENIQIIGIPSPNAPTIICDLAQDEQVKQQCFKFWSHLTIHFERYVYINAFAYLFTFVCLDIFYLSAYLCVLLSVCPSVRLSVSLSVCQSVSLSVCQSVSLSVCQSVSLSVCQSVSLSVCQSVSLSVCQSVSLSVCQSVSLSVCQSVSLSVCQSVSQSVSQSVCLSVCLSDEKVNLGLSEFIYVKRCTLQNEHVCYLINRFA